MRNILHIQTPQNLFLSEARNIGVHFAQSNIIACLDDDGIAHEEYIASIISIFHNTSIVAMRGKVLPKTDHNNNQNIGHYDLGNHCKLSLINAEGNSAFRKEPYLAVGGMHPLLFGHEGWEISCKLFKKYDLNCLLYNPQTIIYHDYAYTDTKLETKNSRHALMAKYIKRNVRRAKRIRDFYKQVK
jgi:glycosyltransferase involved in cell wall biosynthesis